MKKETTIIVTAELTKHIDDVFDTPIEEYKQDIKKLWLENMGRVHEGVDNINITNVQVFELEKEERISTEDLIKSARECITDDTVRYPCENCIFNGANCKSNLVEALIGRLEELHQQAATPKWKRK